MFTDGEEVVVVVHRVRRYHHICCQLGECVHVGKLLLNVDMDHDYCL